MKKDVLRTPFAHARELRGKVRAASRHLLRHQLDALGRGVVASELLVRRQAEWRGVVKKCYFRASLRMILDIPVDDDQKLETERAIARSLRNVTLLMQMKDREKNVKNMALGIAGQA